MKSTLRILKGECVMSDLVFLFVVVGAVVSPLALLMSLCEWAHKERRVPFFVKWYKRWNRIEGIRRVKRAKKPQ